MKSPRSWIRRADGGAMRWCTYTRSRALKPSRWSSRPRVRSALKNTTPCLSEGAATTRSRSMPLAQSRATSRYVATAEPAPPRPVAAVEDDASGRAPSTACVVAPGARRSIAGEASMRNTTASRSICFVGVRGVGTTTGSGMSGEDITASGRGSAWGRGRFRFCVSGHPSRFEIRARS